MTAYLLLTLLATNLLLFRIWLTLHDASRSLRRLSEWADYTERHGLPVEVAEL